MNRDKSKPQIVQHSLAIDNYLRTLLEDIPEVDDSAEQLPPAPSILETVLKSQQQSQPIVVKKEIRPKIVVQQTDQLSAQVNEIVHALAVMPEWAQQEFPALFFQVEQLILATPLIDLSRTIKMERCPTKIPGQPSWFLGLLEVNDTRVGVLDTGQLIFGKTRGSQRDLETSPFRHILITQDKRWGLACDEILSIAKLKPDKVRWRTQRKKRAWLIGTVIEELTAVIDVKQLVPHRKHEYQ